MTSSDLSTVLGTLRASHDRLAGVLERLSEEQVSAPSYDTEWSVADVAAHLGSGAEVFTLILGAGTTGRPAPGPTVLGPVWDRWNAKTPAEQVADAGRFDDLLVSLFEGLSDTQKSTWRLDLWGTERDLADVAALRLSELVVHTWDIEVALDPAVTLPEDAAALLVPQLAALAERTGQTVEPPLDIRVMTTRPERSTVLALSADGARLRSGEPAGDATLKLPTEAFARLVYGRLDADHTPADVKAEGVDLDLLRRTFPGL